MHAESMLVDLQGEFKPVYQSIVSDTQYSADGSSIRRNSCQSDQHYHLAIAGLKGKAGLWSRWLTQS